MVLGKMNLTGYRAFLLGTARDQIPVRGIWVTFPQRFNGVAMEPIQRRDDVEPAAGDRAFTSAAHS